MPRFEGYTSTVSPTSGQYLWHLILPRSTMVVSMMIRVDWHSQVIYQKSMQVVANGPWVAMYLKNNHNIDQSSSDPSESGLPVDDSRSWNVHDHVVGIDVVPSLAL